MKPSRITPSPSAFDGQDPANQMAILEAIRRDDSDQQATTGLIRLIVWSALFIIAAVVVAAILI